MKLPWQPTTVPSAEVTETLIQLEMLQASVAQVMAGLLVNGRVEAAQSVATAIGTLSCAHYWMTKAAK